jgi:type II secretory pathway pseudopilin PulG
MTALPAPAPARDDGVTLVELIIAVALLGTAAVTILAAFGTLIKTSDVSRKNGDVATTLAAVAESTVDNTRNPYNASCVPIAYNPTNGVALPPTIPAANVTITDVQYWDGADGAFKTGLANCNDTVVPYWRLQLITLRVVTADGKVDRSISVVKRG